MNEVVIAAAGGGKTTQLAARARMHVSGKVAVVTYTTNNVEEISRRFYGEEPTIPAHIEVWSWYSFLLQELARPYQNSLIDRRIEGLHWVDGRSASRIPRHSTFPFFMTKSGLIYSDKISRFIVECNKETNGAVVRRLEDRFNTIFIDEVQDLAGYDLELLELILRSRVKLVMLGDHRQATYATNHAAKNKAYGGINIIDKFRYWQKSNLLDISYSRETFRCHQLIADLADSFYPSEPKTLSRNQAITGHDGTFLVSEEAASAYVDKFAPQILRFDSRTKCDGHAALNFGASKGMTFDRVLIFPHKKAQNWLKSGDPVHIEGSLAKMYVGVTRARYSLAFVFSGPSKIPSLVRHC